MLRTFCHWLHS